MTKQEKERAIIKGLRNLPSDGYGKYHFNDELWAVIGRVMGYLGEDETAYHMNGYDLEKCDIIVQRMLDKKIIKFSATGSMFRLI